MKLACAFVAAAIAAGCTTMGGAAGDSQFASCAAYAPAYQVTDEFMRTFNTQDVPFPLGTHRQRECADHQRASGS